MRITAKKMNGVSVLMLEGSFDVMNSNEIRDSISAMVNEGYVKIIINLENVESMSDICMGVLVDKMRKLRKANGDIKLCKISDRIEDRFMRNGLHKAFEVYDSEEKSAAGFMN